jgi:hypothetical protein
MRSKQINLFRNVFEVEQRRRRMVYAAFFFAIVSGLPLVLAPYFLRGVLSAYQHDVDMIEKQVKDERVLLAEVSEKLQKAEVGKRKDWTDERIAQLRTQANIIESKVGSEVISLLLSTEPTQAKLIAFIFKTNSLSVTGEAINRLSAIKLMDEISYSLNPVDWVIKKRLLNSSGEKVLFELTIVSQSEGEQK